MSRSRGFTLIELMIVVVVVALLATIAYPSYVDQVARARRSAAQAAMMDIANRQQQFFLANRTFASKDSLEASGYALPSDVSRDYTYLIAVSDGPPPRFEIEFTAVGPYAARLGNLKLDSAGNRTPADKW